jgi:hypothetical protein
MNPVATYSDFIISHLPENLKEDASNYLRSGRSSEALANWLRSERHTKNQTRYRFSPLEKSPIHKAIFSVAVQRAPNEVIEAAEAAEGRSFYPLWKRVTNIHLPRIIGNILKNPLFRGALAGASVSFIFIATIVAYLVTGHFVSRAFLYIANNTPEKVIRVFNVVMSFLVNCYVRFIGVLFCVWAAKHIILLGPEIPYLTAAMKSIDSSLFLTLAVPSHIVSFAFVCCCDAAIYISDGSERIGQVFLDFAKKGESEKLFLSKKHAYALWIKHNPMC